MRCRDADGPVLAIIGEGAGWLWPGAIGIIGERVAIGVVGVATQIKVGAEGPS
jgi:hypothetical protein